MQYFLIIPLCILAVSKITIQSRLAKQEISQPIDAAVFNSIIFLSSALFSFHALLRGIDHTTVIYGGLFGLCNVLFQFLYCFALRMGTVSVTVLIINCSMLIPVIISVLCWNESLTIFRIAGIILILLTFILNTSSTSAKKIQAEAKQGWEMCLIGAFLANSGCNIVQKAYTYQYTEADNTGFVASAYVFSTILSAAITFILLLRKRHSISHLLSPKILFAAVSIGGILCLFQILNTYALSRLNATVLLPAYNGGTTLLASCAGLLIFHENLKRNQIAAIIIGVTGIVCLCL